MAEAFIRQFETFLDGGGDRPDNDGFCRRSAGNETVDGSCRTICIPIPTNYTVNVIKIYHKVQRLCEQ